MAIEINDIMEQTLFDGSTQKVVVVKEFGDGGGFDYRVLKGRKMQKTVISEYDETGWRKVGKYEST